VEEEKVKKRKPVWIWVLIIVVIVAALATWFLTREKNDTTDTSQTDQAVVTPPEGWQKYSSSKYKFSLYHPADYIVTEGATGTIKLTKGSAELIDLYVYAANGDPEGMMTSQEALYTDDAKGYMVADEAIQIKVANQNARIVNGKFGKNAGISQTHEGVTGSAIFFAKNDNFFVIDSYDRGDQAAKKNFDDLIATVDF